ncbi:hypothetical protein CUR178_02775 [Leishmania enriettii]|uniref:Uncharacterized protein n=1 Tax=Leishmania enriettii TaxID=5663 RepID=A0A836GHA0_LEIEN|nr:hypothetical protein CUR178_02775 [Leishmania enriettii]
MDTTPAWLVLAMHSRQRRTVPVNAAGVQVGPPVLLRNPNRHKRGGYGPGTIDGPSPTPSQLSAVSGNRDRGGISTSGNTTPHRGGRCCRESSVCFTDAPIDYVDYGDFLQVPLVTVTAAAAPQPSILRKSSSFPRALPPLFDFEYESPHTPQRSLAEVETNGAVCSTIFNGAEKSAKGSKQASCPTHRPHFPSAAPVSQHFSLSLSSAHHPLRKNSDPSLGFVMDRGMGNTATASWAVHQLPLPESAQARHLPSEASQATADVVPPTPSRSPSSAFGTPPIKVATPDETYGALYTFHRGITSEVEVHADKAEWTASPANGNDAATSTSQRVFKQLTGPPRTMRERSARVPCAPHALPLAAEDGVGKITSDLAQGTYTFYCAPPLNRLAPMHRADAVEDDVRNVNRLLIQGEVAVREPNSRKEQMVGIDFCMDSCLFARQASSTESEVRSSSSGGSGQQAMRNAPSGTREECMENSDLSKSQTPSIESKATPRPPKRPAATRGTAEDMSPTPTDAADADYEYVNPSTSIAVSVFPVSPPLCVGGLSRASPLRGEHAAAHALPPREVCNSVGIWGRHAMLTLLRRFAYTSQLRPMPSVAAGESSVGYTISRGKYAATIVRESPRSTVAPTSLVAAPPKREPCSDMADLHSISICNFEEDAKVTMEVVNSVESVTTVSSKARPSSPQSLSDFEARHQSRWTSIRERLKRPLICVAPDSEERRLPSLLQRYRATIEAKVLHFAQSRSSSNSSAALDPLRMRRRPKVLK